MSARPPARGRAANDAVLAEARDVLLVESQAIAALVDRLDERFARAVEVLAGCAGRIITTGMGKSGMIARKLAATFSSTGSPAFFLHPAEAVHGDAGNVVDGDVVVAFSHSGETEEIARLLEIIKRIDVPLIALTGALDSTLARHAVVALDVAVQAEACPLGLAPTASTTAALAMGDALAMSLLRRKGFRPEDFAAVHPAGRLGARLRHVSDLMHQGEAVPRVRPGDDLRDVIPIMTGGRLGLAVVCDANGRLVGVLTDGDLRRVLESQPAPGVDILARTAGEVMTRSPRTIAPRALASEALREMETHKITALVVIDDHRVPVGVVHLHDLWRTELV